MSASCRLSRTTSSLSKNVVTEIAGRRSRFFFDSLVPVTPASTIRAAVSSGPFKDRKILSVLQETNAQTLPEVWFSSTSSYRISTPPVDPGPHKPRDDRKAKLGTTLRILQERLPRLLQSPLPQEILAPNISLHLFPSTHPYLPTVSGRVAYIAALWTAPVAWNCLPIIGDVKLEILSERIVRQPGSRLGSVNEKLVVRWKTRGKGIGWRQSFRDMLGIVGDGKTTKEFWGLFIFEFDGEGRVLSHTIEHVQSGGEWDKGIGAKVVGLTDWLLGGMRGRDGCPAFEIHREQTSRRPR